MDKVWEWLYNNRSWIFDGIGAIFISGLVAYLLRRRKDDSKKQTQVSGDDSVNIQVAGDATISNGGRSSNGKRTKSNQR
jgi:hypothetical protein